MSAHQAKFGDTICEVHIEQHPTINGGPIFIGKVFELEADGSVLREIHSEQNRQAEVFGDSTQLALDAAVEFFERRFGDMDGEWSDPTQTRKMIASLPPRRRQ